MAGGVQSLNIVIGANTEALKKGMDDAVKAVQGGGRTLEQDAKRVQKSMERMLRTATDPGANLKQQARQLTNLAGAYMAMGEEGSAAFQQITREAINVKRQMEDVNDAIMVADLEGRAKMAAMGFAQATQAIAGATGAMHLLGISTDDAAKITAQLQSLMAISQGIEAMVALEGTVTALTRNIKLATVAQKALNFAMTGPGAAIIAGVAAIAVGLVALSHSHKEAAKAAARQKAELEDLERSAKATKEAISEMSSILDDASELQILRAKAAGKSERELFQLEEQLIKERIATLQRMSNDGANTLDQRIAYTGEAINLENRLERMRLNEQIRINNQKKNLYKKDAEDRKQVAFQMLEEMRTMRTGALSETGGAPTISVPIQIKLPKDIKGRVHEMVNSISGALNSGIASLANNMAGALGDLAMNIVAGAEKPLQQFGDTLLQTLSGFMQTLGQAMISAGLASQAFQKTLFTQPGLAIAAGAALIVAAGAVKGIMQKGIDGRKTGGDTDGGTAPGGIRPFADGGIISGPTLGLMGEYPGASSNPEVVAPLNKLKDLMGGSGNLTARISGQDLLIMLDRAETNRGRVR